VLPIMVVVTPFRSVLSAPGVPRTFGPSLVARIPLGVLGLLLVLRVRDVGGSYAAGGVCAGALALGLAAGAPIVGRAIDARGQTRILVACAVVAAAVLTTMALLPDGTPLPVLAALGLAAGAANPPLSACQRALWPRLLADRSQQHAAFALESVGMEVSYILGPLVIVTLVASRSPALALAVSAALLLGGTVAFAAAPHSRSWAATAEAPRGSIGALASPGVVTLLLAQAFLGASIGMVEVSTAAFAGHAGAQGSTGLLLSAWGLGSMAGGVAAGRLGAPADAVRRLLVVLAGIAATTTAIALAPGTVGLGVLIFAAGAGLAPYFTTLYGMAGDVATEATQTEAFTWLSTGFGAGIALGSPIAGSLADLGGGRLGFVAAGAAALLAAAVVRRRDHSLAAARHAGAHEPAAAVLVPEAA
jgi:MFS family permease